MAYNINLDDIVKQKVSSIKNEVNLRMTTSASNVLRNSALEVLSGQRSGKVYRIPYSRKTYRASAPGEPPANRTGMFRLSWTPMSEIGHGKAFTASIGSRYQTKGFNIAQGLEGGTSKMSPRPYQKKIVDMSKPKILDILKRRYNV